MKKSATWVRFALNVQASSRARLRYRAVAQGAAMPRIRIGIGNGAFVLDGQATGTTARRNFKA